MTPAVQPILTPCEADMRAHVEHLFGGYLDGRQDGRIELAWTDPEPDENGRFKLRHSETFDTDDDSIDRLIAKANEVNSRPRTNVYIGATLRRPETPPVGRCDDGDFYATTCYWCDLDDKDANDRASERFADAAPSMVVRTGEYPHWRHQLWWRLTDAVDDPERVRAAVSGLSAALGGDGTVSNPSRVMRLAGTIAWDQKPGRRPELTRIIALKSPGLKAYMPEHVERAYPPLFSLSHARVARATVARATPGPNVGIVREKGPLGLATGKVVDGRERHMTNVICARLIDYCGQFGAVPTPDELLEHAWDAYERSTDLKSRPGRNKPEFAQKCQSTMRRFAKGKIRGAENLEAAVASYQMRREARQQNVRHEATSADDDEFAARPADDVFEFLDIAAIKAMPDPRWVVKDMIPEDGLGFLYGPPGHGKTFVALSLALHVAYGMTTWWWGAKIDRPGLVLYIAREGLGGLKSRIEAWQRTYGIADDAAPFALVRAGINFMDEADIAKLIRTVEAAAQQLGAEPSLVFVDTVSRVLPGADENLQKEMTLFVAACDALRDRFKNTVVGVHHAGKNGDMRGSTVLKGAGDFVFKVEKDAESGSVRFEAEKVKDAEDGWTRGVDLAPVEWSVEGVIDGERKSLVAVPADGEGEPVVARPEWPDRATCKQVLRAIGTAWNAGTPWSPHVRAKSEGRYAARKINVQFGISADVAESMVQAWLDTDILSFETVSTVTKLKGLRVVGSLD